MTAGLTGTEGFAGTGAPGSVAAWSYDGGGGKFVSSVIMVPD